MLFVCLVVRQFNHATRSEETRDVHHQEAPVATRIHSRWRRCDDRAAVSGCDGAGADAARPDGGGADRALRLHLRPARLDHEGLDAGAGRRRLRILADPQAARAVPRSCDGADQPVQQRRERPLAEHRHVAERHVPREGQRHPPEHDGRPDHRAAPRAGDHIPVDRAGDRRSFEPSGQLRGRFPLLVHEHHLVAHPDAATADGDQPARGVRAHVRRRRRHTPGAPRASRSEHQPARRDRRERRGPAARPGAAGSSQADRIPGQRA